MLTRLKELIPGAENWPIFVQNTSQQFEARYSMVRIESTRATVFFDGQMSGSNLPIVVSHGEGRAQFSSEADLDSLNEAGLIPIRYTDNYGSVTEKYPFNPNGSKCILQVDIRSRIADKNYSGPEGIAAVQRSVIPRFTFL